MTSSYTTQQTDSEALSQPRITLNANDDSIDEAADLQDRHIGFGKSQSTSLLQIPVATPAESASSITEEIEDELRFVHSQHILTNAPD